MCKTEAAPAPFVYQLGHVPFTDKRPGQHWYGVLENKMTAVGANYEVLFALFLSQGGDPEACPFDTDDYKYEGPLVLPAEELSYSEATSTKGP